MEGADGCMDSLPYLTLLVVILSPFLFKQNSALHYHGKFFVYYILCSTVAVFLIPVFLFTPCDVGNSRRSTYITRHVAKLIGVKFTLENADILAADRGAFVVSNHQSTLDILGLFNIWEVPSKVAAIARKEVFYVWPFGLCAWLGGVVFIDRTKPEKAYETLRNTAQLTSTEKTKIWLFPEGTRNKNANNTKKLLPFKRGAFKMAVDCQAPIIPVVFSPYYFLNPKLNFFGQGEIIIKALPPIETKGLTNEEVNDLIEKTYQVMQHEFEQLHDRVVSKLPKQHPFYM